MRMLGETADGDKKEGERRHRGDVKWVEGMFMEER